MRCRHCLLFKFIVREEVVFCFRARSRSSPKYSAVVIRTKVLNLGATFRRRNVKKIYAGKNKAVVTINAVERLP